MELLVYSRSGPGSRREVGEIIDIRPDGWNWGSGERTDPFRIVRVNGEIPADTLQKIRQRMNRRGVKVRLDSIPTTRVTVKRARELLRNEHGRVLADWSVIDA